MSNRYRKSSEVPNSVLCQRLEELSEAVTRKGEDRDRELTLRIPAEVDRDVDLVLEEAARRIKHMESEIRDLEGIVAAISNTTSCMDCGTESGIHHHNCGTLEGD